MTHLRLSDLSPRERIIVARALLAVRRPSLRDLAAATTFGYERQSTPKRSSAEATAMRRIDAYLDRIVRVLDDGARLAAGTTPAPAFVDLGERRCECGAASCTLHEAGRCQNTATTHAATVGGGTFPLCSSCAAALGWS